LIVSLALALGCGGCEALLNTAVHTHTDDDCKAAARHLNECCPNFHDGVISCVYDDRNSLGEHGELSRGPAGGGDVRSSVRLRAAQEHDVERRLRREFAAAERGSAVREERLTATATASAGT
jgi:hypothetical protein